MTEDKWTFRMKFFPFRYLLILSFSAVTIATGTASASSGEFVQTGDMTRARPQHRATLLEDGRVLVTSGFLTGSGGGCPGRGGPLPDADVYDPSAGTFSATGAMSSGRYLHSQVRLNDGRVLVAGGVSGCIVSKTASTDLFDPQTNQFTATGAMSIGRSLFPMHKLPSGDVLVFGGEISGGFAEATDRVEKYDVSTGAWSIVGHLSEPKGGTGICGLTDGRFLIIGGRNRFDDRDPSRTKSAEIYNPVTNTTQLLSARTNFEHRRFVGGLALQDGRCLFASQGTGIEIELYDPTTETFSVVPPPPGFENAFTTSFHMSLLPDGSVLHVGNPSLVFDPISDTLLEVNQLPGMSPGEQSSSTRLANGQVLIGTSSGGISDDAVLFIPSIPPTADAGPDQAVRAGDIVNLDGTASFDDNTSSASLIYSWSFSSRPDGSSANLNDPASATPSFVADAGGTYVVELVVTDGDGLSSVVDQMEVGSDNLAPTAVVGDDQLIVIGTEVTVDGSASSDPESDPLTFVWMITARPLNSNVQLLSGGSPASRLFTPDLEGVYEITLTVSDAIGPGISDTVSITAATSEGYAETQIGSARDFIDALPPGSVTSKGNQNALLNFLSQAIVAIQSASIEEAISKLEMAIIRTDGCILRGAPDGNGQGRDWITDCAAQTTAYNQLNNALNALAN